MRSSDRQKFIYICVLIAVSLALELLCTHFGSGVLFGSAIAMAFYPKGKS